MHYDITKNKLFIQFNKKKFGVSTYFASFKFQTVAFPFPFAHLLADSWEDLARCKFKTNGWKAIDPYELEHFDWLGEGGFNSCRCVYTGRKPI